MNDPISDGARVIGAGVPITIGGEEHRLLFDMEALEIVEDEIGGLLYFTTALNGGFSTKRIKSVRVGLQAALAHEGLTRAEMASLRGKLQTGIAKSWDEFNAVHRAICEAFDQATPPAAEGKRSSKASGREKGSRGPASIDARSAKPESEQASSAA